MNYREDPKLRYDSLLNFIKESDLSLNLYTTFRYDMIRETRNYIYVSIFNTLLPLKTYKHDI